MRTYATAIVTGSMLVGFGTGAWAQEKGQVGLTLTYPASAGITWHATNRIGLRATVGFSHASNDTTYSPTLPPIEYLALGLPTTALIVPGYATETSSTTVAFSVSGLFYLSKADGVSTYVSPRLSINRASYHSEASGLPVLYGPADIDDASTQTAFAGLFGVQYAPSRRFSTFAEVGIEHQSNDSDRDGTDSRNRSVGTRGQVGVILYLGK